MKKILFSVLLVSVFLLSGCQKDSETWLTTDECNERSGKPNYICPENTAKIGTISDVKTKDLFCCK